MLTYLRSAALNDANIDFKPKTRECVYYKEPRGRIWRAAIIASVARQSSTPYTLQVRRNGTVASERKVSRELLKRVDPEAEEYREYEEDFKVLADVLAREKKKKKTKDEAEDSSAQAQAESVIPYLPLHEALEGEKVAKKKPQMLRIATFNVCHLGGVHVPPVDRDRDGVTTRGPKKLSWEKVLNLAATVKGSLADAVVLQEVDTGARAAVSCVAREIGPDWRVVLTGATSNNPTSHGAKECYALIYNESRVKEVLGGAGAAAEGSLRVQSFMYDRMNTGDSAFRSDAGWGNGNRADFTFAGASGARLPGFFRIHHSGSERSLVLGTIHAAFSNADVRELQFKAIKSLLPETLDSGRVIFALLGDFNSDATNTRNMASSVSFADTAQGSAFAEDLKERSFVNVSSPNNATSIGGMHYDEVFVPSAVHGRRHAHVFPTRPRFEALAAYAKNGSGDGGGGAGEQFDPKVVFTPVEMRSRNSSKTDELTTFNSEVYTDHFLVFVDLEFKGDAEGSFSKMTVAELRAELKKRNQKVSGKKAELIARLTAEGGGD
ncbi:hypothetical protein TrST_g1493 [Triparma strigata]|uniref:SAP domain-containing protein n=1 Tax=Triparma strigata TaxID=1606541 RepID=A0A9W7AMS8_9STRA|nr:hypothetical protein TrST_g1493 [Triparma strigata]